MNIESGIKETKMRHQTPNLMPKAGGQAFARPSTDTKRLMLLNPHRKSLEAERFEAELRARVVGQERAVSKLASLYQVFHSGLANPTRPIATMLFLGPTGSGKTHVVEAAAEALF